MKILALDTATENCSAALLIDERLLAREQLLMRGHAEHILSMADELLTEGAVALASLNAIAFGCGPGAFTGVRLAASVTQGLAFGAGVPVVPVSDLRALAQRVLESAAGVTRVLVCNDARMHEVYWGCFERSADGHAAGVGPEQVGAPHSVALPEEWLSGVHGAGSGFAAYTDLNPGVLARLERIHSDWRPRAAEMARLAAPLVRAGRVHRPEEALPVYLRDQVAYPGAR